MLEILAALASASHGLQTVSPPVQPPLRLVEASGQTDPVALEDDALDDPALWLHPTDPDRSLILGTNKKGGLIVYDLSGSRRQVVLEDRRPNNVDRLQDAAAGIDLVFASERTRDAVLAFRVDPESLEVMPVPESSFPAGIPEVYGLCAYVDPADRRPRIVVNGKRGDVRIFSLMRSESGAWNVHRIEREFCIGGQVEGCVADPFHGWLYMGEEAVGVWRYPLDAASERPRELLDLVRSPIGGHLAADVEGVTLYERSASEGWILVSCQGEDRFAAYDRASGRYAGSFGVTLRLPDGSTDRVTHTDGLCASSAAIGTRFPRGLLIVQDDNAGSGQNFKIVDWRAIEPLLGASTTPATDGSDRAR